MTTPKFVAPRCGLKAFNCPHCGAFAHQEWSTAFFQLRLGLQKYDNVRLADCAGCHQHSIWVSEKQVSPFGGTAPLANPDMPDSLKVDYEEARAIVSLSPRGAAALLRLAIQKLCVELGQSGADLNTDIGRLVEKGLPPKVQKSLDIVRVIGNESVHPGTLDLGDNPETVESLFVLVNLIVQFMISQENQVDALYSTLPETKKAQIVSRDQKRG